MMTTLDHFDHLNLLTTNVPIIEKPVGQIN